jgi:HEAT repeat protein
VLDAELTRALGALGNERREDIEEALRVLAGRMPGLADPELGRVAEAICSLFYVDNHDRPDLEPVLGLAEEILAGLGAPLVPHLLRFMKGSDLKSHLHLARTLGRLGAAAVPSLRRFIATEEDPYGRAFALYALGKVRDPVVHEALPEVVGALMHPDREVRDSAARALGKFVEVVPPQALTERRRNEMFEALFRALGDAQSAVRAKAIRSLGKMARAGCLTREQEDRVRDAARAIVGEDDEWHWDHAYIVRREAEETLRHLAKRG